MFGVYLDDEALVNCGIGPLLNINPASQLGLIRPNKSFKDSLAVSIEGIDIELVPERSTTNAASGQISDLRSIEDAGVEADVVKNSRPVFTPLIPSDR